jgi:hypothetical protein
VTLIVKRSSIKVHTTFEGVHFYPGAPELVKDLQSPHRHVFHVRFQVEVFHEDREIEFFLLKHDIEKSISSCLGSDSTFYGNAVIYLGACSCEMIAQKIYDSLAKKYDLNKRKVIISVSEDDNNEGILEVSPSKE